MPDFEVRLKHAPNVPRPGDPRKVPSYAYPSWGLHIGTYRVESDRLYASEWEGGSPRQMQVVVEAITRSGLGNFSQLLRDANAKSVARFLERMQRIGIRTNYLEIGAGQSTVDLYSELDMQGFDLQRLYSTLVEPSGSRIEAAAAKLEEKGLKKDKNFRVLVCRDIDIMDPAKTGGRPVEPGSQNIVSAVATIHHHAYLGKPFRALYDALAENGAILIADWHNPEWEHPARVRMALEKDYDDRQWTTKEEDIARFNAAYPKALEEPPPILLEGDAVAMDEIRAFWRSYGEIRAERIARGEFNEADDILMLEGHRPVERQIQTMERAGFRVSRQDEKVRDLLEALELEENPYQLRPESRSLMLTAGLK